METLSVFLMKKAVIVPLTIHTVIIMLDFIFDDFKSWVGQRLKFWNHW